MDNSVTFWLLVILALLLIPNVVIWINWHRIAAVRAAVARLEEGLRYEARVQAAKIAALRREIQALKGVPVEDAEPPAEAAAIAAQTPETAAPTLAPAAGPAAPPEPATTGAGWFKGGLERQFAAVLPVWIGGVALAFAGFFLIKYSIEHDLLGPGMRVVLAALAGLALIAAGHWVRSREIANGARIAQALSGAGIAVLYVAAYAASSLYALVPPVVGFLAMAANTALAVILSLRHGPPIALMGLVGGFLTPALVGSESGSAPVLFLYLYGVFAALMMIIRRQGWWLLSWPLLLGAFSWVLAWVFGGRYTADDIVWIGGFLAAVAGTIVYASRRLYATEAAALSSWRDLLSPRNHALALNAVSLAGALGLMAVLAFNAAFGLHDWVLFAVLATGGIALALFDDRLYFYVPWAAMAINGVMLAGWYPPSPAGYAVTVTAFGALYCASGLMLMGRARVPLMWAGLSATAAMGYYLLGYFRLSVWPVAVPPPAEPPPLPPEPDLVESATQTAAATPYLWGAIAMVLALLFFAAALRTARRFADSEGREPLLALFALATAAFVALALTVELERDFLPVAIAGELLAVAWVSTRTLLPALRAIAALLGLVFAFLLLPQILLLVQLTIYSLVGEELPLQDTIPIVAYPHFQLALPAALFLGAAAWLRRGGDGRLIQTLEGGALALIALWGYYLTRALFHTDTDVLFAEAGFFERGLITSILFVYGLACLVIGRWYDRFAFAAAGALLCGVALFRLLYFDLLTRNPLWSAQDVLEPPLFNALPLTYGLPILWSWLAMREARGAGLPLFARLAGCLPAAMLVLVFALISLEIRQFYQGNVLNGPITSDAEFYSYSAVWLLFGLTLLFLGTLKGHQLLRGASLAVMLLVAGKVFLLDASELTGLYRVFSFLGLGISLIGLSYFYSRFVFAGETGRAG